MIQRYAQFWFSEKGLGIVSPPHFMYDVSRKMFLVLYFINWPNFSVWLPLLLEILCNMCIAIVCFPGCDVLNFQIRLQFQRAFSYKKLPQTWENAFKLIYYMKCNVESLVKSNMKRCIFKFSSLLRIVYLSTYR